MDKDEYAVFYLYNEHKDILLQFRARDQRGAGVWGSFGGHLHEGESPEQALVREAEEEAGYQIRDYELLGVIEHRDGSPMHLYIAPLQCAISELRLGEGAGFAFVDIDYAFRQLNLSSTTQTGLQMCREYFV